MCRLLQSVCHAGDRTAKAVADVSEIANIVKHNAFGSGEWSKPCCFLCTSVAILTTVVLTVHTWCQIPTQPEQTHK